MYPIGIDLGPGALDSTLVGQLTVARTFELTARRIMAYATGVKDLNPQFFDDLREDGLIGHPFMSCSFQWNTRFMPQAPLNVRAAPYGVHSSTVYALPDHFAKGTW